MECPICYNINECVSHPRCNIHVYLCKILAMVIDGWKLIMNQEKKFHLFHYGLID